MIALVGLVCAAAGAAYIVVGYPLWLAFYRGSRRPPVRKDPAFRPSVTVIVAVYNGEAFLRAKLESILGLEYPPGQLQIVVVSDGSTDQTAAIAEEYAGRGVQLLVRPHGGKAACLNAAFEVARGEILFFTDVRQILDPAALGHLAANFADPTVGAVTGEMRLLPGEDGEQQSMGLYWRYELWARRKQSEIDSLFNTTGCIYALRRCFSGPLPVDTLSDDAVLPQRAFFAGCRVIFEEQAIALDYPALPGTEFRRRWRNLAGLWQVHVRRPELFTSRNRMRLHFLSHKFGRLALPWVLLAGFLFMLALPPGGGKTVLLAGVAVAVVAALLDPWVPGKGLPAALLKKFTSPLRLFLIMNAASAAAVIVFFIPAQKLWRPTRVLRNG